MRLADMPDDDVLLETYAVKVDEDRYELGALDGSRSNVLGAIKINLALDGRPTLILTSDVMLRLIRRIEALEDSAARPTASS